MGRIEAKFSICAVASIALGPVLLRCNRTTHVYRLNQVDCIYVETSLFLLTLQHS